MLPEAGGLKMAESPRFEAIVSIPVSHFSFCTKLDVQYRCTTRHNPLPNSNPSPNDSAEKAEQKRQKETEELERRNRKLYGDVYDLDCVA